MVVVPLTKGTKAAEGELPSHGDESTNWIRIAAASTLAASGALLITGNRRAGLLAAVTGTALAMFDQQEAICAWWDSLPGYLEEVDAMLERAQNAVTDLSTQGQKLRRALGK
ncbi:MAG: hypothetical protein WBC92_05805 [Terracidiphilus sp.]